MKIENICQSILYGTLLFFCVYVLHNSTAPRNQEPNAISQPEITPEVDPLGQLIKGIWYAESRFGMDKSAWQSDRYAVGSFQISRSVYEEFCQDHPEIDLVWPDDFINEEGHENSLTVLRYHLTKYSRVYEMKHKGFVQDRNLALIWRYGWTNCISTGWSDPEGYWDVVRKGEAIANDINSL